ncbi:TKL family protein kinase [Tritrichomonas foetus]|uniref:TKL family protein kinase n=1 Tax=Tritrichomonas foetus TaxID=1144522 RepID=A0A1J4JQ62_9EUKA|nr:TKL family protein kinase [Tritrichomonas foetus]|eukprot:OHS99669.1 TKL family protein kinase [Tritrichomonas foetus]
MDDLILFDQTEKKDPPPFEVLEITSNDQNNKNEGQPQLIEFDKSPTLIETTFINTDASENANNPSTIMKIESDPLLEIPSPEEFIDNQILLENAKMQTQAPLISDENHETIIVDTILPEKEKNLQDIKMIDLSNQTFPQNLENCEEKDDTSDMPPNILETHDSKNLPNLLNLENLENIENNEKVANIEETDHIEIIEIIPNDAAHQNVSSISESNKTVENNQTDNSSYLENIENKETILISQEDAQQENQISDNESQNNQLSLSEDDSLIDFSAIPINNSQEESNNPPPQWVNVILSYLDNLLSLQPSIVIHRSKLFALYDSFRKLRRNFKPNVTLNIILLKANCCNLIEAINKTRQIVYSCSASHWGQSALTWPTSTVKDSVRRLREDIKDCLITFQCIDPPDFSISDTDLTAQDSVDKLQLKGSLLEYLNRISEQPQTPQIVQLTEMIAQRVSSIGPVDGIQEGPSVLHITPFLPPRLNLVLTNDDFEIGEKIGSGTFGSVHKGKMTATGKPVAIKMLNASLIGGRQLETYKREVWTMATLNHPSILHLIGVTLSAPFCIVTELLKCSLYDRLRDLTPTKRSVIALRVSQAMEQLHSARIIHRDLKSANILLDDDDLPRVCDFGLVGFKTRGTRTGYVGTAQWMAPEILRSSPFYDEKVDVYSFAVLLWELLFQQQPYANMTQDQMVLAILERKLRPTIVPNVGPPRLIELMTQCWSEKPSDRPSFPQITATLFLPETHFYGTNEEEFRSLAPKQLLSTNIVHAFDCCNWHRFDELLQEITPQQVNDDPELVSIVVSLFPNIDSGRQVDIIRNLPKMVNLEQFLSLKGYSYICSLFSYPPEIVDSIIKSLRTVPLSSKAFRQVKLISAIASTPNVSSLQLCADLCQFEDIAQHITDHNIPFSITGMDIQIIRIYKNLLKFPKLREKVSTLHQPIVASAIALHDDHIDVCECLINFNFSIVHSEFIINTGLIPVLISIAEELPLAMNVLTKIFAVCSQEELLEYKPLIDELIQKHQQLFIEENVYAKLISIGKDEPLISIKNPNEDLVL